MGTWIERVQSHQIWKELEDVGPVLDHAASRWGANADALEGIERVRAILTFCGKRLAATDAVLLDPRPLATIATAFAMARTELQAFSGDLNVAHIVSANAALDDILGAVGSIVGPLTPDELTQLAEAAGAYRTALHKYLEDSIGAQSELKGVVEANHAQLSELAQQVASEKERLSKLLAEHQTQFSAAQDARATEHATAQTERQTKFAANLSEIQTGFSSAQDTRAKEFSEAQADRQARFTAADSEQKAQFSAAQDARAKEFSEAQAERVQTLTSLVSDFTQKLNEHNAAHAGSRESAEKSYQDTLATLKSNYEEAAQAVLNRIEEHKVAVEKLVGVIGNLGVTSGYQKIANRAQKAMYLWQALTVLALGGLIFVAYVISFAPPVSESVFFQGLSTRVFLSITVGIFAAYAARQASNNLEIERRNRKLALELEALGPFLAPLPIEMQNKFRADMGERSFGIPDGDTRTPKDPVTAIDMLKELRELIAEVSKKAK
jgi:hypothetical protein